MFTVAGIRNSVQVSPTYNTVYRQSLKTFAKSDKVAVSSACTVLTANLCRAHGGCSGFISVIILLAVHLATVTIITALYISQTRFSRHSNAWHAVAQLVSNDLYSVLLRSSNLSDQDVTRFIEKEGNNDMVAVGKLQGSSRVEFSRSE